MTLPQNWARTTLGECSTAIQYGLTAASSINGQGYRYVRITDIQASSIAWSAVPFADASSHQCEEHLIASGDILFARTGATVGKSYLVTSVPEPATFASYLIRLKCHQDKVNCRFASWFMQSPDYWAQVLNGAEGTGQPNFNGSKLAALQLSLPPLAEQNRIVGKLDILLTHAARARAEIARVSMSAARLRMTTLRQAVTGMLTETWRGQRSNVETAGDMLRRVPPPQQGRGGREATDKIIPGRGGLSVNDPGTALPAGWQWVSLLRLAKQETGHTPSRSQPSYWKGGVPWMGIRDAGIHHGCRIDETVQTISEEGLANSSARLLPAGTVCLSRTASVGYVTILGRPMATSQDFATWTCGGALLPEYLMLALLAEGDDIRKFGMGSTHTTIYFPEIRALHVALPSLVEQREIIARAQSALARADRFEAEAAQATKLLDRLVASILAKAFRGELVPQDPTDEPASALLERLRIEPASAPKARRGRSSATLAAAQ